MKFGLEREKKIDGTRKIEEAKLRRDMFERDLSFTRRNDSYSHGVPEFPLSFDLSTDFARRERLFFSSIGRNRWYFASIISNEFHRKFMFSIIDRMIINRSLPCVND